MITDKDSLSLRAQCRLLGLARSDLYYEPVAVTEEELALRGRLDRLYTAHPYYGSGGWWRRWGGKGWW